MIFKYFFVKPLHTITLFLFTSTQLMAQDDVNTAKWKPGQVIIDGVTNEWSSPLNLFENTTGLLFSIANDSSHIYLCFTTNNPLNALRLLTKGWDIEFNSKEKNKKFSSTIHLPGMVYDDAQSAISEKGYVGKSQSSFTNMVNQYKKQFININTEGFTTKNGSIPVLDKGSISIAVGEDSIEGLVFEIGISMKELYGNNIPQLKEELTLNVHVRAMETSTSQLKKIEVKPRTARRGNVRNNEREKPEEKEAASMADRKILIPKSSFKQKFRLTSVKPIE